MAWPETKREPLALRIFRHTAPAEAQLPGGGTVQGRGVVAALGRDGDQPGGERHDLGELSRPLYRFLGYLPGLEAGSVLIQGGERYRVLEEKPVSLGGRRIGLRALLEREEREEDSHES